MSRGSLLMELTNRQKASGVLLKMVNIFRTSTATEMCGTLVNQMEEPVKTAWLFSALEVGCRIYLVGTP